MQTAKYQFQIVNLHENIFWFKNIFSFICNLLSRITDFSFNTVNTVHRHRTRSGQETQRLVHGACTVDTVHAPNPKRRKCKVNPSLKGKKLAFSQKNFKKILPMM